VLAADDDDLAKDDSVSSDVDDKETSESEFAESDGDEITTDLDEFSDDTEVLEGDEGGDEADAEIEAVVELSSKEQSARSLKIRHEIERRMEERRLHEDVDYFDLDLDE
jgi:hypothetical protein